MRRVITLVVIVLMALSAGVFAEDSKKVDEVRFRTFVKHFDGHSWLTWDGETRSRYAIAHFAAVRQSNVLILGHDPDGIGRMYESELAKIISLTTGFYKENPDSRSVPLYNVLSLMFQKVVLGAVQQ